MLSKKLNDKDVLLDTNILIYQLNGTADLADELVKARNLYISAITEAELFAGVGQTDLLELREYLSEFKVLPVSSEVATLAGAYKNAFPSRSLKDLIIAATAQQHQLLLLTANKKDFAGITTITASYLML